MADSHRTIGYCDCFSGISGDMLLGALIDAGLPPTVLDEVIEALKLQGVGVTAVRQRRGPLAATLVTVTSDERHPHRGLADIRRLIEGSGLSDAVKTRSITVFQTLAHAEAQVHGQSIDEIHFHEVGAVDAMVDIVGAMAGLERLGIEGLYASPLPMPHGWVRCDHGRLPLPAPAVTALLTDVPVYGVDIAQELVTPTGAAILKSCAAGFGPMPPMHLTAVGHGAGQRQSVGDGQPNLLRLILGRSHQAAEAQTVEVIETHLDDWSPEGFPHLSELLFAAGALDVSIAPLQMKKGRPGFLLRVVTPPAAAFPCRQIVLTETAAIGLRYRREHRWTLPRQHGTVDSPWGPLRVKRVETPAGPMLTPEYDDCQRIAADRRIPLREVYRIVAALPADAFRPE